MSNEITVTIAPENDRVRMLATCGSRDILKAVLGPAPEAHSRAAATVLEGLALWHQRPLSVVLCVDAWDDGSALGLFDGGGLGQRTLHYQVGVAIADRRRRRHRAGSGFGEFGDLRQLSLLEVAR